MTNPLPTHRFASICLGALIAALCVCCRTADDKPPQTEPPACIRAIASDEIDESSGLARSRQHPGIFWTHNDSGGEPRLFALTAAGQLMATASVEGADNVDWEEVAIDDEGYLYIGDIGNNDNDRRDLVVYRVPEPDPFGGTGAVQVERRIPFHYPEQQAFPDEDAMNFDAESLFWARGRLYLLTKHRSDTRTRLYRFPSLAGEDEVGLELLASFDLGGEDREYGGMATAADASPDGRFLAVLTYHALFLFERPAGGDDYLSRPLGQIDFDQDVTQQCEAVSWDGWSVVFTNEQGEIHRIQDPFRSHTYPATSTEE